MKIPNHKHQISPYRACGVVGRAHGNKLQITIPKFKTNPSKESFTKERFCCFCHWNFGNLVLFRISDLGFRIYMAHKVLINYGRYDV